MRDKTRQSLEVMAGVAGRQGPAPWSRIGVRPRRASGPWALRILFVVVRMPVVITSQQIDLARHAFPHRHLVQP